MGDEFFRMSTVTGKKYNIFETVKILNINQCIYYMQNGFYPVDIKISQNEKGNKCLVFYYNKDETKKIYEDWRSLRK
jgi:hypothetical protein